MSYKEDPVFNVIQKISQGDELQEVLSTTWEAWGGERPKFIYTKPTFIEYQPFEKAWIVLKAEVGLLGGTKILDMVLQFFALPENAENAANAGRLDPIIPCGGPPMFTHTPWSLIGYTLPNGPHQKKLRQLLQPGALSVLLKNENNNTITSHVDSEASLYHYVPSIGAVVGWHSNDDSISVFAKIGNDESSMAAYSNMAKVHATRCQPEFQSPAPIRYCKDLNASIYTGLQGLPLDQILRNGPTSAFVEVGRALAGLHSSSVTALSLRTSEQEIAELMQHMNGIRYALPELTPRLTTLLERLSATDITVAKDAAVPIHGNPRCEEILYNDGRVGSTNWEFLALGDPLHDVGRLAADIVYHVANKSITETRGLDCLEAIGYGYQNISGELLSSESLAWHLTVSLLIQAKFKCLRRLRNGWRRDIDFIFGEAERTLKNESAYVKALAHQTNPTLEANESL